MARKICIASTLLALSTFAVSTNSTILNITLSIPGTPDCGTTSSEAITFSLTTTPPTTHCFNLNSTFATSPSNATTTTNHTFSLAGFTYTLLLSGASHFDDSQNYSQVSYLQPSTTPSPGAGNLTLKTYNGLDCVQVAESDGLIEPWTEWTCSSSAAHGNSSGECTTLPYPIRSFEIGPVDEKRKGEKCVVAAAYGKENAAGRKRMGSAGGVVVGAALGFVLLTGW